MTEPFTELTESELAAQAGRASAHPFALGQEAARKRVTLAESQPFTRGSNNAKMFARGYNSEINKLAAETRPQPEGTKVARKPVKGVQEELIPDSRVIGKEAGKPVKLSAKIKKLLGPVDDAIYNAALYKGQENEFKEKMQEAMAEDGITEVTLPRGGKLIYNPGKPSLKYVKPSESKADANGDGAPDGE